MRMQSDLNWRPHQISLPHQCRGKMETDENHFARDAIDL